jgi:LuxR family maltose regulon positive regulatory protein
MRNANQRNSFSGRKKPVDLNAWTPECRLLLVVAPAGTGKTTMLRQWAAERQWPVAWVTVNPADNRPQRFLQDVRIALQAVGLRDNCVCRNAITTRNIGDSISDLINDIVEMHAEFALVLDSYQVIDAPATHDGVRFLLDYLPPQMHLVIASRTVPPLQLARLRVRRQLVELRPQDLSAGWPSSPGNSP